MIDVSITHKSSDNILKIRVNPSLQVKELRKIAKECFNLTGEYILRCGKKTLNMNEKIKSCENISENIIEVKTIRRTRMRRDILKRVKEVAKITKIFLKTNQDCLENILSAISKSSPDTMAMIIRYEGIFFNEVFSPLSKRDINNIFGQCDIKDSYETLTDVNSDNNKSRKKSNIVFEQKQLNKIVDIISDSCKNKLEGIFDEIYLNSLNDAFKDINETKHSSTNGLTI